MGEGGGWTFLSNHSHVLLSIAVEPEIRLRDVAKRVGITERAVQRIVSDLEEGGYLTRERTGRRNSYRVHADRPLRHPIESHRHVKALLALVLPGEDPAAPDRTETLAPHATSTKI
ncbi:MAG: winged helix-turn-helix domain-containing protein [Isosphaeraceae bacterium]|nr:winged helix-turn-helix domain-containing protein [Isosphaeraceae bacterium]